MEGDTIEGGGRNSLPQLLNLIPSERDWMGRVGGRVGNDLPVAKEELELRLGPPGGEEWPAMKERKTEPSSIPSLGYSSKVTKSKTNPSAGAKRGFLDTQAKTEVLKQQQQNPGFLGFQSMAGFGNMSSQKTDDKKTEHLWQPQSLERKACSRPDEVPNGTQARIASASVVGWPPIRSFRKNLSSTSLKSSPTQLNGVSEKVEHNGNCSKGLFVKINMDGIPIGRKVDLKAYDSYEQLSSAVDELFRGLLLAQSETLAFESQKYAKERQAITGLLDGTGEYTLVYEDNEGDRMLAGDVPWEMFLSTVKRLRVLKSSELPALSLASETKERTAPDSRSAKKEVA